MTMAVQPPELPQPIERSVDALRAGRSAKWRHFPPDVLPAWIADMDFEAPPPVQQAIQRLVDGRDYGYTTREGAEGLAAAFAERMQRRFGWAPDPALVQPVSELVQALYAGALAFSAPGDGCVVQTPIYPPFLRVVAETGRRLIDAPLADDGSRFVVDLEATARALDDGTRILLLCNPHNPTGRAFTRAELQGLARLAVERDLIVLSDEIHADLVYPGGQHIPFASLGPEVAARTVTLISATKSFNIPALRCAVMHFGTPELRQRFRRNVPEQLLGQVGVAGIDATVAAWRHGQPWLDATMALLAANRERVQRAVDADLPGVRHYAPEATYLAWLDCRSLDLPDPPQQFFLERARVGLIPGAACGPAGEGYVRLNFATSPAILEQVLGRMAAAVRAHVAAGADAGPR
jgi:cystathionine beta-lyase